MDMLTKREQLIEKYIEFFKKKGHKEIPNASLIPSNDPTVLFTTAGMHPLVPYLLGQKHALGKKLVNVQKCIRTGDINDVGDDVHLTFFEMLGNWSLGDYFKKEAIEYSFEFLTKELGIKKEKISVTCFAGDKTAEKDTESAEIWRELGITKIKFLPKEENWWGPAGDTGPCGPDTEMFVNDCEIWNNVFMQYIKVAGTIKPTGEKLFGVLPISASDNKPHYILAKQKNVDTGMGVERTLAILNNFKSVYETECFKPIIREIEKLSGKKNLTISKSARIIADHIKASVFIISDGVIPSNVERGYVLRRLIRRAIRYGRLLEIKDNFITKIANVVIEMYQNSYPELKKNRNQILTELDKEENKFQLTLESGMREFEKISKDKKQISGKEAFLLYQSYGFPIEMTCELAEEKKIKVNMKEFEDENKKHQELSRTLSAGQFKSGLADNSKQTKKLHTATHLLNEALREILRDKNIHQKGSNINPERLRFDFNFGRKLTDSELKAVEDWINDKIKKKLNVEKKEMKLSDALKSGARAEFGAKYPEIVSVYTISDDKGHVFSREICTGPHVDNTSELGKFKILKEESSAAGIRRIKAKTE